MAQKSLYFMKTCAITQGKGVGSHLGSKATDHGGAGTYSEKCYMPWDGRVVRCRAKANGEMYIESLQPVEYPDGTIDYQKALFVHDDKFNVSVGTVLKQGDYFYDEGGMGSGNPNAFGTHVHVEFGRGKWKSAKQTPNKHGVYVIEDQIDIEDAVFMPADIVFRKDAKGNPMDGGLNWKYVDSKPPIEAGKGNHAVDLNQNQGKLDFNRIMNAGKAKAVGIRTGYGSVKETQTDPCFEYNVEQCLKHKLPMFFYNFSYAANVKDAIDEANMVIELLAPYKEHIFLPVYFDFEEISARYLNKTFGMKVTKELVQEMAIAFCERIKEAGYIPGVYSNLNCYNLYYGDDFFERTGYSFWYCRPGKPEPDKKCDIWQCDVNNGKHFGIDVVVDQNVIYLPLTPPIKETPVEKPEVIEPEVPVVKEEEQIEYIDIERLILYVKSGITNYEYFTDRNINKVAGKLEEAMGYNIVLIEKNMYTIPGTTVQSRWVKILVDGEEFYTLIFEDRAELYQKAEQSPVQEPEVIEPEIPEEEQEDDDTIYDGIEPPVPEDSVPDTDILPEHNHDHTIYECLREVAKWILSFLKMTGH